MTTTATGRRVPNIDPRIRERRREIRRHEGRRRLRRLGVLTASGTRAAGGALVVLSPVLDVDRVVVRGAVRTDPAEVERASGIDVGDPMVTLARTRAAKEVETLPWVARATVARSWPGTVIVSIDERTAVAVAVAVDGRRVLLDAGGRQLGLADEDDQGLALPIVEGLPVEPAPGRSVDAGATGALELAGRLVAAFPGATVVVTVDRSALEARIAPVGSAEVRAVVGTSDRLADKVLALVSVVEQSGAATVPVVVDIRAPDAPALTRGGPPRMLSTTTRGLHNSQSQVEV